MQEKRDRRESELGNIKEHWDDSFESLNSVLNQL